MADGVTRLNEYGEIVAESWQWLSIYYDYVELDEWVIMPNHLHGIIIIIDDGRGGSRTDPTTTRTTPTIRPGHPVKRKPVGRLIGAFKTVSTKNINTHRNTPGMPVWQRDFFEHIIRNNASLNRIRKYIVTNPLRWWYDRENPNAFMLESTDRWCI